MSLIDKENILVAQYMYASRIDFLNAELSKVVNRGLELGKDHEIETMAALDELEEELKGIDECLELLRHLLWS